MNPLSINANIQRMATGALAACLIAPALAATCIPPYVDRFSDGVLDTRYTTGGSVTETGGQLIHHKPANSNGGTSYKLDKEQFVVCGDFQVCVDFTLVSFPLPTQDGRWASLQVIKPNPTPQPSDLVATIERYDHAQNDPCVPYARNFKAWLDDSSNCFGSVYASTAGTTGTLQINRVGSVITLYANGQLIRTDPDATTDDLIVHLYTGTDNNFQAAHDVAFDNLKIIDNSGRAKIYWADQGNYDEITHNHGQTRIRRCNLDGTSTENIFDVNACNNAVPSCIALDPMGGMVYWGTANFTPPGENGGLHRGNMNGSGAIEDLIACGAMTPRPIGLAVDDAAGKLFWSDPSDTVNDISMINMDGTGAIETRVDFGPPPAGGPTRLALNPGANTMYFSAFFFEDIYESAMYAPLWFQPLVQDPVVNGAPFGMALDALNGHVYWTTWDGLTSGEIQRSDLNGNNVQTILTGLAGLNDIEVDPLRGLMYFIEGRNGNISGTRLWRANLDGTGLQDITPSGFGNAADIALDTTPLTGADVNQNGIPDSVGKQLGLLQPGDADGNGSVDFDDLNEVLANWGTSVTPGLNGDVNGDGVVDFDDLNEVLANWGASCPECSWP